MVAGNALTVGSRIGLAPALLLAVFLTALAALAYRRAFGPLARRAGDEAGVAITAARV